MENYDIAIVASTKDLAGMNIAGELRKLQGFPVVISGKKVALVMTDKDITLADDIDKEVNAEVFVFASKHVSKAGVHSLSVHSIGSWGEAIGGGRARNLVPSPAALMKQCFKILAEKAAAEKLDYEVILEGTHHGPYLERPSMFIEIGSDEERWQDKRAGKVVAETIIEAIKSFHSNEAKSAIAIGGMHHCPNFYKVMLSGSTAISYACPKYLLERLDEEMLRQAIEKSLPKAVAVVLDWKGMGKEKDRIVKLIETLSVKVERTSDY